MRSNKARLLPYLTLLSACISTSAFAGIGTISRANCIAGIVNESVTYDRPQLRSFHGSVLSEHKPLGNILPAHTLSSVSPHGWRHYAGDLGDPERMLVTAAHTWVITDESGNLIEAGTRSTSATDCNISEW